MKRKQSAKNKLKQLGIFQLKLAADALRDLVLSPISLLVTLMDIFEKNNGEHFQKLMAFGRKTDEKINLFEHFGHEDEVQTIDKLIEQMESVVKNEYQNGAMSNKAKEVMDKTLWLMKIKKDDLTSKE